MKTKLTEAQLDQLLGPLKAAGWCHDAERDALEKRFAFENFEDAFAWMTQVAGIAEALDHHPEWTNVYNRVDVCLTTHDAGGLTELDMRMARMLDDLLH